MINYTKYIIPVYDKQVELGIENCFTSSKEFEVLIGNGVFVGDYFVTAYHVIDGANSPYIKYEGKIVALTKAYEIGHADQPGKDGRAFGHDDPNNGDVIVFKIDGVGSPFRLSESLPAVGQKLENIFYKNVHNSKSNDTIDICAIKTTAVVKDAYYFVGNFFGCDMTPMHPEKGGSSGSPIFDGNIVYGILHGGKESMCVFCSSVYTLKVISNAM